MAGLKEIRNRITSIKSTQQITSAMKMVSASKLRRAQTSILKLRPYTNKFNEIISNLGSDIDNVEDGKYSKVRDINKVLIVAISSNRGLCGSFNTNIIRKINSLIEKEYLTQYRNNNVYLFCIGKKAHDYFSKRKFNIIDNRGDIFNNLTYEKAGEIADKIIKSFTEKEFDRVIIVYNKFKNAAVQMTTEEQSLPVVIEQSHEPQEKKNVTGGEYIFEPSQQEILSRILPDYIRMKLYKNLLESNASEHGARMTSMHIATDNASEILKQLTLSYNKARQATITKELLEIVSGAEALKG